jgi:cytochrome P450
VGTVPGLDEIWYLARHADCETVFRHPASGSDASKSPVYRRLSEAGVLRLPQSVTGPPSFAFQDPPDHTRLRKLVSKALARSEGEIAISSMLSRFPRLRLAPDGVIRRPTFVLRCLDKLQLEF